MEREQELGWKLEREQELEREREQELEQERCVHLTPLGST